MNQKGKWEQALGVILLIVLLAWVAYADEIEQKVEEITQPPAEEKPIDVPIVPEPEPIPPELPIDDEKPIPVPEPDPDPIPVPPTPIPQIDVVSPMEAEIISGTMIVISKFNYPEQFSNASIEIKNENYSFTQELLEENSWIGEWDSTLAQNGEYSLYVNGCIEAECTQNTVNFFVENKFIPIPVPIDENELDENFPAPVDENFPEPPTEQKFSIIPSNVLTAMSVYDLNGEQIASSSEKIELQKGTFNATISFIESEIKGIEIQEFDVSNDFTFVELAQDFNVEKTLIGLDENSFVLKTIALKFGTNFAYGKIVFNYLENATHLFECSDFDFENANCLGEWTLASEMSQLIPETQIETDSSSKGFVFASLPEIIALRDKQLIIEKLHESFAANQPAEFKVTFEDEKQTEFKPEKIDAKLIDPIGNEIALENIFASKLEETKIGEYFISLPPKRSFKPGAYQLVVTAEDGNFSYEEESAFMWGVIAINTKKSIYKPNETAQFEIVVLDELSFGVCDADMQIILNVTSPDGNTTQITKNEMEQLP
ncbi:MAG: hypothetical protein Q7K42_04690, partial [Candidatus Diapherotrites archaeon]|nr:hypothetical protein [Candidatus Diapherotrites archaeon]